MIQEIEPRQFNNAYSPREARDNDFVLIFRGNQAMLLREGNQIRNLLFKELFYYMERAEIKREYLFSIDEKAYFLILNEEIPDISSAEFVGAKIFRELQPKHMAFANITGMQLYRWRSSRKYCGHCGSLMEHSNTERSLFCKNCGLVDYPKISPAVIVAITDGDKLLLTKYLNGEYQKYALVAGFVEVGESFEETVKREVMEEVGLKVKNIRYYKSQPWAFSDTVMIGFFAELEGNAEITLQEEELSEAVWMERDEIPPAEHDISIGQEMIELFRNYRVT